MAEARTSNSIQTNRAPKATSSVPIMTTKPPAGRAGSGEAVHGLDDAVKALLDVAAKRRRHLIGKQIGELQGPIGQLDGHGGTDNGQRKIDTHGSQQRVGSWWTTAEMPATSSIGRMTKPASVRIHANC